MSDSNMLQLEDMRREGLVELSKDEVPDDSIPNNENSSLGVYEDNSLAFDHDITTKAKCQKGKEVMGCGSTSIYTDISHRVEKMATNDPIRLTLSTIGNGLAELLMMLEGFRDDSANFQSMVKHFESINPLEEVRKVVEAVRKRWENALKIGEASSKEMDLPAKKRRTTENSVWGWSSY